MSDQALPQPARRTGRKVWIGLAISGLTLFLAFRGVNWADLLVALRAVDLKLLVIAVGVLVLNLVIRGLRWQVLLRTLGNVPFRDVFAFLNIGYMVNDLLPLRAGEVVRSVLLASKEHFNTAAVLATVVVERLLDMLVLAGLALLLMQLMPLPALVKQAAVVAIFVAAAVFGVLWWFARRMDGAGQEASLDRLAPLRLRGAVTNRLLVIVDLIWRLARSFAVGLGALRSPRQAGVALGYSLLAWSMSMVYTWLVLRACQLDIPIMAALMVVVVVNLGLAIPSSPGYVGVMHFLAVLALTPWAVAQSSALSFAIIYHGVSFLTTLILGLIYLWREGLQLGQITVNIDQ